MKQTRLDTVLFTLFFVLLCIVACIHPLQCSCLEDPSDRGTWWAAVYGVAQSRTQLSDFHVHLLYEYKQMYVYWDGFSKIFY